jgi:flavodoxin II
MMKIGLFYGSTTCYTEMAAEKIQAELDGLFGEPVVSLHNIKDDSLTLSEHYDLLIYGISTWDYGELQEDWESQWADVLELNLQGKLIALYGMGDQVGYTDWFQDALGMLHQQLQPLHPVFIGYWPNSGYEFTSSKALTDDTQHFVGLALDDETQYNETEQRISTWCQQLLTELAELIEK